MSQKIYLTPLSNQMGLSIGFTSQTTDSTQYQVTWPDLSITLHNSNDFAGWTGNTGATPQIIVEGTVGDIKYLDCSLNNEALTHINADECIDLKTLYCTNNAITMLDVSMCSGLYLLDCNTNTSLSFLNVSGCINIKSINCNFNELTSFDISKCINLSALECKSNPLSIININTNNKLKSLDCSDTLITTFDIVTSIPMIYMNMSNCFNLTSLDCVGMTSLKTLNLLSCVNLKYLNCSFNVLTSIDITTCVNLQTAYCTSSRFTSFDASKCNDLQILHCYNNSFLTNINLNNCINLEMLDCHNDIKISSLDISDCTNLKNLECFSNDKITDINASNLSNLNTLNCYYNVSLSSLNVSGCINLMNINCFDSTIENINLDNCINLKYLYGSNNMFSDLDMSDCFNLIYLDCSYNTLTSINLNGCSAMQFFDCTENLLSTVNISDCVNLQQMNCDSNSLTSLDAGNCLMLQALNCYDNNIIDLNVVECESLEYLNCYNNNILSLNASNLSNLKIFHCYNNNITNLDVMGDKSIIQLYCNDNNLNSLDLHDCVLLVDLLCNNNNLDLLDVSNCVWLNDLLCNDNILTTLKVNNTKVDYLDCHNNNFNTDNVNKIFKDLEKNNLVSGDLIFNISNTSQYGPEGAQARAILLDRGWTITDDGPLPPADPTTTKISEPNPDQVHLRDYERIYTGTNQEGGYENPFLGFTTDTASITFKADKSTYFHYPKSADQVSLSATDLIESGAFAGAIPYKADKIFKKNAGYENDTPWGKALPENMQNGVWLCAWLSGNDSVPSQTPIWMDRWYDPGSLNSTHSLFVCSTSAVYDEPSSLTFDPGVWYRYDHIGDNTNLQITSMICALDLHIDDWDEVSSDSSGNGNDATLYNFTSTMISSGVNPVEKPSDKGLALNGVNQYGSILFDSSFNTSDKLTCNIWIKSSDWRNQPSHHFISNGLRGGWSIGINNGFFTPFNALITQNGSVVFNNQTGNFYKDIGLPGAALPVSFAVDSELYTWVLDNGVYNGFKHLYKIDFNGNIENAVYFPITIDLYDVVIDENNLVWVSNSQSRASAFDAFCEFQSTSIINNKKLVLNSSNSLTAFNAIDACVFEDTYYWTIDNLGDLYCNNALVFSGLSASNVQCSKDYVWALFDDDKILRIDKEVSQLTNDVTFSVGISTTIPDTPTLSIIGRNLFFTNENGNDYIWILQPNIEYLYKYDTSLNLIQKTNIVYVENSIQSPAVRGDASGYQWHRLFNFSNLQESATPQIEAITYIGTGTKYKTVIPTSILSQSDWHMFTFNINAVGGSIDLYMDTILRSSTTLPISSSIFYKYETPLLIGSNIGHIDPLDTELNKINQIYHLGSFDDLRIYTDLLNNSDIRHIYLTKFGFKDLVWGLPVGTQSYIEEIVRFFKFKMPGQKSQYYNIHLKGLQITDESVRQIIEDIIKDAIQKIAPLYTSLYKIVWD